MPASIHFSSASAYLHTVCREICSLPQKLFAISIFHFLKYLDYVCKKETGFILLINCEFLTPKSKHRREHTKTKLAFLSKDFQPYLATSRSFFSMENILSILAKIGQSLDNTGTAELLWKWEGWLHFRENTFLSNSIIFKKVGEGG